MADGTKSFCQINKCCIATLAIRQHFLGRDLPLWLCSLSSRTFCHQSSWEISLFRYPMLANCPCFCKFECLHRHLLSPMILPGPMLTKAEPPLEISWPGYIHLLGIFHWIYWKWLYSFSVSVGRLASASFVFACWIQSWASLVTVQKTMKVIDWADLWPLHRVNKKHPYRLLEERSIIALFCSFIVKSTIMQYAYVTVLSLQGLFVWNRVFEYALMIPCLLLISFQIPMMFLPNSWRYLREEHQIVD